MSEDITPKAGDGNIPANELDESKLPKFSEIDPNSATPEQVAELVKAGQTLLGLQNHWRGKAIDKTTGKPYADLYAEAKSKAAPAAPVTPPAPIPTASDADVRLKKLEVTEEKRQFGHANNLNPEETDTLFALATGMNLKPVDALKLPFFTSGLEASRQLAKNGSNTPRPSSRMPIIEGKTFEQMNPAERKNNFGTIVKNAGQKG